MKGYDQFFNLNTQTLQMEPKGKLSKQNYIQVG